MPEPRSLPSTADGLSELKSWGGATRLSLPVGQVLLYREHRPPGVFVVLSGALEIPRERGRRRPVPARLSGSPGRPALLPRPERLEEPSADTWTVAEQAEVLYLPRSLVNESSALRALLRRLLDA